MYQPGSIRKIEVKNFVTYSHAEFYPGPKLNIIIGPNGTGKSTMVAAIILGLGGNPKVVGRGDKVSEYVKHNCTEACINIYIQDDQDNKFIKVTRVFDTKNKTSWKLNDKNIKLDGVLTCIKQFNIQVNNLCQFLPQDRVQDFAKLEKKDLLKETQKALCRYDLIEKQNTLIESMEQHKRLKNSISNYQQKLQECEELNARLEGRVQSFNKKKKYEEIIEHIERKIAWTMYEDKRVHLTDVKEDRKKAQEVYDKYKNDLKPVEKEISEKKKSITDLQQNNNRITQTINHCGSLINTNLDKIETVKESVRTLKDDMETKLAKIQQIDEDIRNHAKKVEDMKRTEQEMSAKIIESDVQNGTISTKLTKLLKLKQTYQNKQEDITQKKQDYNYRIQALENESNRLENVKQKRLEYIRNTNPDVYTAVNWLRNNKHLFKGEIYEPIILEVNVLDTRHAKYLENVIAPRDRLAFTCIYKEDMNKLIKSLREEQHLRINVVHSDNEQSSSQYQPDIPIENLRQYGFYTYMNNLFTAPEPIKNYLCKTYKLQNIPLGDKATDDYYENLPTKIRQFFSEKYKYNIIISKYSGQKSIRQTEVGSDGSLSFSLDVVKLDQLKGEIAEIKRNISNLDEQTESIEKQSETLNQLISDTKTKLKEIQQKKQELQVIKDRIETAQRKLVEWQQVKKNPNEIRNEYKRKADQVLKTIPAIHNTVQREVVKVMELEKKQILTGRKIEEIRKQLAYLENEIVEKKRQCQESEHTLNKIKEKYNEIMDEAKALLSKAKSLSNGFTPGDAGFDEFRSEYDNLTTDIQELNDQRIQFQSRIDCLRVADDGEMQEFESRLQQINSLKQDLEKSNTNLNKMTTKMAKWEEEWLVPLKQLLQEVNLKFASAFERMGCAGEISVCTGENDRDFSQYGISIKVTYRSGEPLQELNSNIQSGGERAVATAAYMLSLQELTPVPFRCVDEINQGMDVNNERRIFELVMDTTCQNSSSQYFLITPKLIPHLRYGPNMIIHIVHNGPFVAKDKKWSFTNLCNFQNVQIA